MRTGLLRALAVVGRLADALDAPAELRIGLPPALLASEQARERLTTAITMYREMGMTYWLEKAETQMREPM